MSDVSGTSVIETPTTTTTVSVGRTWVTVVTMTALIFNAGVVVYLILYGASENSLHSSALSWAYMTSAGILAGLGFGSLTPFVSAFLKK